MLSKFPEKQFSRQVGLQTTFWNQHTSRGATDLFENTYQYLKLAKHKLWLLQPRLWEIFLHGLPMICKVPAQNFTFNYLFDSFTCGSKWCGLADPEWLISFLVGDAINGFHDRSNACAQDLFSQRRGILIVLDLKKHKVR
jgi:hypothetical protein